jgi:predicted transcriptional regulator YdeE
MEFREKGAFSYIIGFEVTHTENVPDEIDWISLSCRLG